MGAIHHPFYLFIYNTESFFNNTERVEKDNLNIIFSTESFWESWKKILNPNILLLNNSVSDTTK